MTIDELNVIIGADDTALGRGLASAISKLQSFATAAAASAAQAGQGLDGFANRAGDAGTRAADNLARGFSSLNTKLSATFAAADKQMETLEKGFGRLGDTLQGIGKSALYVTAAVIAGGVASVSTAAQFEKLQLGLQTLSKQDLALEGVTGLEAAAKSASLAKQRFAELTEVAKAPGIGLEQAVKGDIRLRSVGISADLAKKSLVEFANAIAKSGGDAVQLDQLTVQLGQLGASAKLTAADLKPILNAAPSVAVQLQKLYGTVSASGIQKQLAAQGQSTKDFIDTLVTELAKSERATGGLGNSFDNLGNAVQAGLATVGASIAKNLNLQVVVDKIASGIEALSAAFANLSPTTQKVILGFAGVAAAVGPILVAVGVLVAAIPAVTAGFATLGITSLAALAPILPIAAAVAAAAYLIYDNWDDLVSYFDGEGGQLISNTFTSLKGAVGAVVNAFSQLFSRVGGSNFGDLISSSGILKTLFKDIVVGIQALADTIAGTVNFIVNLLSGNFREALRNIGDVVDGLTLPIRSLLGLVNDAKWENTTMSSFFAAAAKNATSMATAVEQASKRAQEALTPLQRYMRQFAASMDSEDYAQMFDTLDELKEKRDELLKVRSASILGSQDFTFADTEIIRLNALIKKYEDTGKSAKKATDEIAKAFADIRIKVNAVDTRVQIGVELNYDGLQEKIKILQDGIKTLTDKGVTGSNPGLQALVRQLAGVQAQVEAVKAKMRELLSDQASVGDGSDIYTIDVAKIQEKLKAAKLTAELQFSYDKDLVKLKEAIAAASNTAKSELIAAGVPTSTPGASAISEGARETKTAAFDATSLQEYLQAMKDISAEQQVFGAGFNSSAAAMQATTQRLRDLIRTGQEGTPEFAKLTEQFKELKAAAEWDDLTNSIASALSDTLTEVGSVLAEQLAAIIVDGKSGGDALQDLFMGVLGAFGGFLVNLGGMLVQYGLLMLLADALASNPLTAPAAIAVGLAAIAVGMLFKATASKGTTGKGASGGYSPSTSSGSTPRSTASTGKTEIVVKFEPVELRADGASLRSVMNVDSYRMTQTR